MKTLMEMYLASPGVRQMRANVRNFLFVATDAELARELELSRDGGDWLRARFIQELIDERKGP